MEDGTGNYSSPGPSRSKTETLAHPTQTGCDFRGKPDRCTNQMRIRCPSNLFFQEIHVFFTGAATKFRKPIGTIANFIDTADTN